MDKIKIFYDGIDIKNDTLIKGYTTNPSILKKYNKPYSELIPPLLDKLIDIPLSIEVCSDETVLMLKESKEISKWGNNIYIKIPIINTKGDYNIEVIQSLINDNINVNITCIFTREQIYMIYEKINNNSHKIILSIFSGRIADTGVSPKILCKYTTDLFKENDNIEVLWASTREVYNIFDAIDSGCDIITIPESIYQKLYLINKDLTEYSKETVQQFISDGKLL
jgi:transaldolase